MAASVLGLLAAAGCGGGSSDSPTTLQDAGAACTRNLDCAPGTYCGAASTCTFDCRVGSDCASGLCSDRGQCLAADAATDTSIADTSIADTSIADTSIADTSVADTSVADTSVADTSVADTFVADTFVADTFVADTFVADTFVADTFVADTFVADTFVADTRPICVAGTYVSGGVCSPCPAGTFSTVTNAASCTGWAACAPGQYVSVAGTASSDRVCAGCGAGTFSATVDAVACGLWTTCNPGKYVSSAGTASTDRTCTPCAAGTYSSGTNVAACTPCAPGSTSDPGATSCVVNPELRATTASLTGDGLDTCGTTGKDVCGRSLLVAGGTYFRGTDSVYPATIAAFRLDKYEVSVGRFRKFVEAWVGGWRPTAGAGKHAHLNGGAGLASTSGGYEAGWESAWTAYVGAPSNAAVAPTLAGATTFAAWNASLACDAKYATWTSAAGVNEKRPQNCLSYYDLQAFCVWDGGFLPSDAEWEYAAAGGAEERTYPWGATVPGANADLAVYSCYVNGTGLGTCTGATNIAPVGSVLAGAGKFGQLDLAGNVFEWSLDWYQLAFSATCTDCANLATGSLRGARGGSYMYGAVDLPAAARFYGFPAVRHHYFGGRCARTP